MVRVTIELLPKGRVEGKRTLGVMQITNDGTGSETLGNYLVHMTGQAGQVIHVTRLRGFQRRSQGAFRLLHAALNLVYPAVKRRRRRTQYGE